MDDCLSKFEIIEMRSIVDDNVINTTVRTAYPNSKYSKLGGECAMMNMNGLLVQLSTHVE